MSSKSKIDKILFQVPSDYYFRQNLLQKLWHNRKWQVIKNIITKYGLQPKNILEIGCAAGHLTSALADFCPQAKIIGADLYLSAIQEAKLRFSKIKFIKADAHRLPFQNNSFDIIVCSETIEHVEYPLKALTEVKRLLKKDAIGIIEMDSGNSLFKFIWYFWTNFGRGRVWKNAHLHNLDANILEKIIKNAKLKIIEKRYSHLGMAVTFVVKNNYFFENK